MFRLWAKTVKRNRTIQDKTIENGDASLNRTKKIFDAIEQVCYEWDLPKPIWLEANIEEFKRLSKTRFYSDNFIESIDFDFLEIQVIEED